LALKGTSLAVRRPPQLYPRHFRQRRLGTDKNVLCQIFQSRHAQALDLVQQPVVQLLADGLQRRIHLTEIPQKAGGRIGISAQGDLGVERMTVQAAVFRRAIAQIMGRVKAEFLRNFHHGFEEPTNLGAHIGL